MTTHLLLSGGGALGAFQAGALRAVQDAIDAGLVEKPRHAIGISVGALNAALCSLNHRDLRWVANFWQNNIQMPSDIAIKKSVMLRVLPGVLRGHYDGLVDPAPLRRMMDRYLSLEALSGSPIQPHAGAVNLNSGGLLYATPDDPAFPDYLMASASIPAIFPTVEIDGEPWADGGLVEVAPATRCIDRGADRILVILCQPVDAERQPIDAHDPWALAGRLMDIATVANLEANVRAIEGVNDRIRDVKASVARLSGMSASPESRAMWHNKWKEERGLAGKRLIDVTVIRPDFPLRYNTGEFRDGDIARAITHGYDVARRVLGLSN